MKLTTHAVHDKVSEGFKLQKDLCSVDLQQTRKSSCVNARGIPPAGGPVILVEVVNKEKIV